MVRRCERVVRRCIYSLPFYNNDSTNLRPLRLVLASPSRPRSVIIVSKMVRSKEQRRRRLRLRLRFHRPRRFLPLLHRRSLLSEKEEKP